MTSKPRRRRRSYVMAVATQWQALVDRSAMVTTFRWQRPPDQRRDPSTTPAANRRSRPADRRKHSRPAPSALAFSWPCGLPAQTGLRSDAVCPHGRADGRRPARRLSQGAAAAHPPFRPAPLHPPATAGRSAASRHSHYPPGASRRQGQDKLSVLASQGGALAETSVPLPGALSLGASRARRLRIRSAQEVSPAKPRPAAGWWGSMLLVPTPWGKR
jgi:hypothetical protein